MLMLPPLKHRTNDIPASTHLISLHLIIYAAVITNKESNTEHLHSAVQILVTLSFLLQCLPVRMGSCQAEVVGDDSGEVE